MEARVFRRDRYLRTSGYHLVIWSLVALVIDLQLRRSDGAAALPATVVVLLGGALLTSMTHERRVAKMLGPAGEPVYAGAGRLWLAASSAIVCVSAALVSSGQQQWLFPCWAAAAATSFVVWGWRAGFAGYLWLGGGLAAVGLVDAVSTASGEPPGALRLLVLGLALPATGLLINRRYVWFH